MKALETGNRLIEDVHPIEFFTKALQDTIVVKKDFLYKIIDEWNSGRGEVTLAKFLLGINKDGSLFLQVALEEIEEGVE